LESPDGVSFALAQLEVAEQFMKHDVEAAKEADAPT